MEGRRVSRRAQRYNPLFILFLCMIAAVIVMLIISITLGTKLSKTNKKLKTAETQVEELKQNIAQLEDDLAAAQSRTIPAETTTPEPAPSESTPSPTPVSPTPNASSTLPGDSEVKVMPSQPINTYTTYYATANVNVRSGPGTNYDRIASVSTGAKVEVAARENGWSFARIGSDSYGWISSDYLSTTQPQQSTSSSTEATSGSLRRP